MAAIFAVPLSGMFGQRERATATADEKLNVQRCFAVGHKYPRYKAAACMRSFTRH